MANYYIFTGDTAVIKTKSKNAVYVSKSLDDTIDQFKKLVGEIRYNHMFMIVDYGTIGNKGLFERQEINPTSHDIQIPFFIIMEYHFGDDRNKLVRADHTEIKYARGFKQTFTNNVAAARCFETCLDKNEDVMFIIRYRRAIKKDSKNEVICVYDRIIEKTMNIHRRKSLGLGLKYITRYKIKSPEWNYEPVEVNPVPLVKIYEKKEESKSDKELSVMKYEVSS